jgi:sulfur-carrier protein adenylyltransferase/sulfurtransferase
LQATETIKILLEKNQISNGSSKMDICSGRVLVFDALRMKFNHVGLARTEGREAITELIDYQGFCGGPQSTTAPPLTTTTAANTAASEAWTKTGGRTMDEAHTADDATEENSNKQSFHAIEPQAAMEKLVNGWSPWVLDVRLQTESDIVSLPFTDRLVPHRTVRMRDVPKTGDVLVYCKAGVRGKKACHRLIEQGVEPERLYNLEGGILRWQKDVDPTMPRY